MAEYIDFNKGPRVLRKQLESIKPTQGTCVFIDMCDSTELKNKDFNEWVIKMKNTFDIAESCIVPNGFVLKHIGDEIMIFIPDSEIGANTYSQIFDSVKCALSDFNNKFDDSTIKLKAAIHYCTNVYNITFIPEVNDYYGIDIDLTARLMCKTDKKCIALSEEFYARAILHGEDLLEGVSDVEDDKFKGIPTITKYRTYQVT